MQDEVRDKSVALAIKVGKTGGKMTADLLKWAMRKYMTQAQNPKIHHGKQTVKQLVKQGQGVQNIEITDKNIKSFEHVAKKYGVDFALKKDTANGRYVFMFWFFDKVGEGYRLAAGADMVTKAMGAVSGLGEIISHNPLPSFNPQDLLIGLIGAAVIRAAVYMKAKNAKKYRHGVEYGSARWGTAEDIKPYIDPKFDQNILLTQTERVMVGRNKNPKYNINKNVLVIGGSGSGKTRFHVKPNLMQMNASYIVTDPKGTVVEECGKMLQRGGYEIKILNTINFTPSCPARRSR